MNLIHPIPIRVEPINKPDTLVDLRAREEIQAIKFKAEIRIAAQVEYREFATHGKLATFTRGGLKEGELGYVAIRVVDARELGWTPSIGDRIRELGVDTLMPIVDKVYVNRIKPFAHYPGVGYLGLKLYFSDKKPSHG